MNIKNTLLLILIGTLVLTPLFPKIGITGDVTDGIVSHYKLNGESDPAVNEYRPVEAPNAQWSNEVRAGVPGPTNHNTAYGFRREGRAFLTSFDIGNAVESNYTLSLWYYASGSLSTTNNAIVGNTGGSTHSTREFTLVHNPETGLNGQEATCTTTGQIGYIQHGEPAELVCTDGTAALGNLESRGTNETGSAIESGTWNHIALTYNSRDGLVGIWVNGTLTAEALDSDGFLGEGDELDIATMKQANASGSREFLNGRVDDVRLFSKTLSGSQIETLASTSSTSSSISIGSPSDGSTQNSSSFTVSGTTSNATEGDPIVVTAENPDGIQGQVETTVGAEGNWSADLSNLADGDYTVTADLNSGEATARIGVTVDTSSSGNDSLYTRYEFEGTGSPIADIVESPVVMDATWTGEIETGAGGAPGHNSAYHFSTDLESAARTEALPAEVLANYSGSSGDPMTYAVWIKPPSTGNVPSNNAVMSSYPGGTDNDLNFALMHNVLYGVECGESIPAYINPAGGINCADGSTGGDVPYEVISTGAVNNLDLGQWNHLALTYDGNSRVSLYVNGDTALVLSDPNGFAGTQSLSLGKVGDSPLGGIRHGELSMDDFRFYGKQLTASEVSSLASTGPSVTIDQPADGSEVGTTFEVSGSASVEGKEMAIFIDGNTVDNFASQSSWTKTLEGVEPGERTVSVELYTDGNTLSDSVTVNVTDSSSGSSNLFAHYKLEEQEGAGEAVEEINGLNAQWQNGPSAQAEGAPGFGAGYQFSKNDQNWLESFSLNDQLTTNQYSASFWYKPPAELQQNNALIGNVSDRVGEEFGLLHNFQSEIGSCSTNNALAYYEPGSEQFICTNGDTGALETAHRIQNNPEVNLVPAGEWSHITLSRRTIDRDRGPSSIVAIYINGDTAVQIADSDGFAGFNSLRIAEVQETEILRGTTGSDAHLSGGLDDIRVYEGVLGPSEIDSVMTPPPPTISLNQPSDGAFITPSTTVSGTTANAPAGDSVSVITGDTEAPDGVGDTITTIQADGSWSVSFSNLPEGDTTITAAVHNGSSSDKVTDFESVNVTIDQSADVDGGITITKPDSGALITADTTTVSGTATEAQDGDSISLYLGNNKQRDTVIKKSDQWSGLIENLSNGTEIIKVAQHISGPGTRVLDTDVISISVNKSINNSLLSVDIPDSGSIIPADITATGTVQASNSSVNLNDVISVTDSKGNILGSTDIKCSGTVLFGSCLGGLSSDWSIDVPELEGGKHALVIRLHDGSQINNNNTIARQETTVFVRNGEITIKRFEFKSDTFVLSQTSTDRTVKLEAEVNNKSGGQVKIDTGLEQPKLSFKHQSGVTIGNNTSFSPKNITVKDNSKKEKVVTFIYNVPNASDTTAVGPVQATIEEPFVTFFGRDVALNGQTQTDTPAYGHKPIQEGKNDSVEGPTETIRLDIEKDDMPKNTQISLDSNPNSSCVTDADTATTSQPRTRIPDGTRNSLGRVITTKQPNDGQLVELSIRYDPMQIDGEFISKLTVQRLNEERCEWVSKDVQDVKINQTANIVTASVPRFSTFRVLATGVPPTNLDAFMVTPNPYKPNDNRDKTGHVYDGSQTSGISFINVPQNTQVKVYDINGRLVTEKKTKQGGTLQWDVTNKTGRRVASGWYVFVVDAQNGGKETGKFAIIR